MPVRRLAEVVDRRDVRMGDPARVRRFAIEAADRVDVLHHAGVHHLQRALAPHLHMLGEIHLAHAAFAELLQNVIALGDDRADEIGAAAPPSAAPCRRSHRSARSPDTRCRTADRFSAALTRSPRAESDRRRACAGRASARARRAPPSRRRSGCSRRARRTRCPPIESRRVVRSSLDRTGKIQSPDSRPIDDRAAGREVEDVAHAAVGAKLLEHRDVDRRNGRAHAARRVGFRRMWSGIAEPAEAKQLRADRESDRRR